MSVIAPRIHLHPERRRLTAKQIEAVRPSAREAFQILREKLLASRPVLSIQDEGTPDEVVEYGTPTFRNVIEDGELR